MLPVLPMRLPLEKQAVYRAEQAYGEVRREIERRPPKLPALLPFPQNFSCKDVVTLRRFKKWASRPGRGRPCLSKCFLEAELAQCRCFQRFVCCLYFSQAVELDDVLRLIKLVQFHQSDMTPTWQNDVEWAWLTVVACRTSHLSSSCRLMTKQTHAFRTRIKLKFKPYIMISG